MKVTRLHLLSQQIELAIRHNQLLKGVKCILFPLLLGICYEILPLVCAFSNVDTRLWPQAIKQQSTLKL